MRGKCICIFSLDGNAVIRASIDLCVSEGPHVSAFGDFRGELVGAAFPGTGMSGHCPILPLSILCPRRVNVRAGE